MTSGKLLGDTSWQRVKCKSFVEATACNAVIMSGFDWANRHKGAACEVTLVALMSTKMKLLSMSSQG